MSDSFIPSNVTEYAIAQEELASRGVEEYWREAEAIIADLTDEELAELKPKALELMSASARAMAEKKDPRKSKLLMGAIVDYLKGMK